MECLIPTIFIIFDIIAIVDAIRSRLAIEKKVLWIALDPFGPGSRDGALFFVRTS